MLFYLGFLTALFLVLIYANYTLYHNNEKLSEENKSIKESLITFRQIITKLQDDVTTVKMKR